MAIRPFKIISLPESRTAFSVKVRPAHGDLPAPSTTGASEIVEPALSIDSPDGSKYAAPTLDTVGNKRSEPFHRWNHGQHTAR